MMYYTRQPHQAGFSLVEVLVAITILLLVIVGPMTVLTQSNRSSAFAAEQVQAFFLAQEGLELAQKLRDDQVLDYFNEAFYSAGGTPTPMDDFLAGVSLCTAAAGCGLTIADDGLSVDIANCTTASNCRLRENPDTDERSRFIHGGGGDLTPFTRIITMTPTIDAGRLREVQVISTVSWRTGSLIASQEVEAVSYLVNIYDLD